MKQPSHPRLPRNGYTLVEVLVVCAIIGILAALAFPGTVNAIKNARRIKCTNNLRQIGIAFAGFAHDHHDQYPMTVSIAEGGSREQNLETVVMNGQYVLSPLAFQAVSSHFKSASILVCPATKLWVNSFDTLTLSNLCYALNLQAEPGSATTPLATDSHLLGDWQKLAKTKVDLNRDQTFFASSRHDSKGNVLFGDGHVETRSSVTAPRAALAAAAQSVNAANRVGDDAATRGARGPTERERQEAYQAANPGPERRFDGNSVLPPSGRLVGGGDGLTVINPGASRAAVPRKNNEAISTALVATTVPAVAPMISPTESKLRRSLFWLWVLLALIGAAMLAYHYRREQQRRAERSSRWQAYATEQIRERDERAARLQSAKMALQRPSR